MESSVPETIFDVPLPPPFEIAKDKFTIFGRASCPDCARVKKFFAENAITYNYYDIDLDSESQKWVSSFSEHIPVVILPDQSILYSPSNPQLEEIIKSRSVNQKVSQIPDELYDVVIIGAGPAGLSAAIYAVRKSLKVLIISKNIGGQAAYSGDIENYLGFTMVTGSELMSKFKQQIDQFAGQGIWLKDGITVQDVSGNEGDFSIQTDQGVYKSKTVIVASGRVPRMLNVPGEEEFFGKGVATCATCDAPLFKGKDVVVVGGGNSALDAAFSLLKLAKSVKVVNLTEDVKGDEILIKNVKSASNVEIINNSTVVEITGDKKVTGVKIQSAENHQTALLKADGVFIEIGWVPSVEFIPQLAKDKQNQITVDEFGKTSVPGIWAAGDVNNLWGEQIIIAAGEGAKVALSVAEHIAKIPHQVTSNVHEG